ncbi:MAG: Crp/Fnr family transcriptional regulator [Proteobacteria bacterium]|nr:Crp/Fnr family transcriptional regulator [Pseudomonadota bacterium]
MKIVACRECPLRALPAFVDASPDELALIESLKQRQIGLPADAAIIDEGQEDAPLYTLLSGWAFRYKTLSDGRRQILNFLLPGDFIGVQQKMADASPHGVQALTDVLLCVFQRDALWALHRGAPRLSFSVTWLTAHEESLVDDTLLSVGRRSAEERIASLLVMMYKRAATIDEHHGANGVAFPLTQQHIADGLGLSLVHTNKTLRKLERRGLHRIENGRLYLRDAKSLQQLADVYGQGDLAPRPLI